MWIKLNTVLSEDDYSDIVKGFPRIVPALIMHNGRMEIMRIVLANQAPEESKDES